MKRSHWIMLNNLLFTVLLLACLGAAAWLSTRYTAEWQWSGGPQARLSEASQRLLNQMPETLRITAFVPAGHVIEEHVESLLKRYARYKPDLQWEFINPDTRPDLMRSLQIKGAGELLVEYAGRREQVNVPTEAYLSAALERLLRDEGRTIAFLSGHGERSLVGKANFDLGVFGRALEGKGFQIRPLHLAADPSIPAEVSLVLVAGPQTRLLPSEEQALREYIAGGGDLLWLTDPEESDRVEVLSEALGVLVLPGAVMDPQVSDLLALDDPQMLLLEEYPAHPVTQRLQAPSLLPQTVALGLTDEASWHAEPILVAAARHYVADPATGERVEAIGQQGRLLLAVGLSRKIADEDKPRVQRVAVIGDGDFLSNTYIGNGANLQLGLNLVDWLTESEVFMDLYAQAAPDQRLSLTRAQTLLIGFGFLTVLPLVLVGLGGWRWWRGRSG